MRLALFLIASLLPLASGPLAAQTTAEVATTYKPTLEIPSSFRCHFKRNGRSFCRIFPNFSRKHEICDPTLLGHIEWCREDVTITERDDCGNFETYEAVTITYRTVYENGAWGEKFKRTYRKEPSLITPPLLAKGVVK